MIYIGQTWNSLQDRYNNGYGYINCIYLNNAIQKYGKDNFGYQILTVCGTQETANYWETYFINKFNSVDRAIGYNLRHGGSNGKLSPETKRKISESLIGVNTWAKGREVSQETKNKQSQSMIGKNLWNILTDDTKNKISLSKIGKPSPNKGNVLSEESRQKMSKSQQGNSNKKGKKVSEEGRTKMVRNGHGGQTWKLIDGKRVWISK
jgi:group I intron endonuclease